MDLNFVNGIFHINRILNNESVIQWPLNEFVSVEIIAKNRQFTLVSRINNIFGTIFNVLLDYCFYQILHFHRRNLTQGKKEC